MPENEIRGGGKPGGFGGPAGGRDRRAGGVERRTGATRTRERLDTRKRADCPRFGNCAAVFTCWRASGFLVVW